MSNLDQAEREDPPETCCNTQWKKCGKSWYCSFWVTIILCESYDRFLTHEGRCKCILPLLLYTMSLSHIDENASCEQRQTSKGTAA